MAEVQLRYIEAERVTATLPSGASLPRIEIRDDRCLIAAVVRRVFPLSKSAHYFSIQEEGGVEVCILKTLDGMDAESRSLVEAVLERRYYSPTIRRIVTLKQDAAMWRFEVETTRGDSTFYVRNWRDSAHEISSGRWLMQSVDGQRYEIPDMEALDARSRSFLDQLL